MPITVIYRTAGAWGPGVGRNLTAAEVDSNFHSVETAITDLEADRPQPNNIASISVTGTNMSVTLDDSTLFGPFPLPVLEFRWRGAVQPFTFYKVLDVFMEAGVGIFSVLIEHITGSTFNKDLLISGDPVYNQLFGADAGAAQSVVIYDMGFSYQGLLSESSEDLLWEFVPPRAVTVPAAGNQHRAYLHVAPASVAQIMPIFQNTTQVGTVAVGVGSNSGTVALNADVLLIDGDRFGVGKPASSDSTAAQLSVTFAATRTL